MPRRSRSSTSLAAKAAELSVAVPQVAAQTPYKMRLTPDGGATWHLARALPRAAVQQMVWLAEPVGAAQLQAWGVVQAVCSPGQALVEALRWADRLAAMAPNAVAGAKELLNAAASNGLAAQLAAERDQFLLNLFHANGGEGLAAFVAKRAPKFERARRTRAGCCHLSD